MLSSWAKGVKAVEYIRIRGGDNAWLAVKKHQNKAVRPFTVHKGIAMRCTECV
jgi:hypothetical protein